MICRKDILNCRQTEAATAVGIKIGSRGEKYRSKLHIFRSLLLYLHYPSILILSVDETQYQQSQYRRQCRNQH